MKWGPGGLSVDSLDTSESVQDFEDRDGNGTREGILISKNLLHLAGLIFIFLGVRNEKGIGTILTKILVTYNDSRNIKTQMHSDEATAWSAISGMRPPDLVLISPSGQSRSGEAGCVEPISTNEGDR